ncbi:MAG TPA: polysaccharide deacetylase family protein [Synergistaceae bacterium]|nr:polysaccharide deacetylase family protein [Synergistaceae bacterium]HQH78116.1 polysaccharide deacetylase family protein [Synergistaceae bacterium]HQK24131.1 polysaccharide deacetylase family protein [Synergistaceae bacterium]
MISRRKAFSWCGVGGLLLVLGGVLPGRVIEAVPRQDAVVARYAKDLPAAWGERLEGVRTRLATTDRVLALTLDACGGEYDEELVAFLIRERIPATLFLTGRWIDRHPREAAALVQNPLFEIANHGENHRPASVTGRRAYGIAGTKSPREFAEELLISDAKLRALGVPAPRYYRSGTNFYDDVALAMAAELGYEVVGYAVAGDGGATFSREQVKATVLRSRPGDIILCHMNRPRGDTAEGLTEALPLMIREGFRFVTLSAYPLRD